MIKIDFNYLFDNYNINLLDNLRGFGSDNEYLKFWVPNTDLKKSFYNLIDALHEVNELEFSISINFSDFEEKFYSDITSFLDQVSSYEKKKYIKNFVFNIKINQKSYQNYQKKKISKLEQTKEAKIEFKNKINTYKSDQKINQIYLKTLSKINSNDYFKSHNKEFTNLYRVKFETYDLNFIIENRKINNATHNCENDQILRKFINIYFDLCLNKDIQEVADHSVIYLEEKIRIQSNFTIKKGIILPSHAGSYFDELNIAIRKIGDEFKKRNSVEFGINKNYFKKSFHWINLEEKTKLQKINQIISEISKQNNLNLESVFAHSIENNFRVNLSVDKSFKKLQEKNNLLLEIEIKIKSLDDTLEVFIEEELDKNKLRIKNSPQTKLLN